MTLLLSPSPRLRGEGRGEGPYVGFVQEALENPVVIPDADRVIAKGAQRAVAILSSRLSACWPPSSSIIKRRLRQTPSLTLPRERFGILTSGDDEESREPDGRYSRPLDGGGSGWG
jgi:hypothetical protein